MGVRGLQSFLESHCSQACYNINIGKIADEYQRRTGKTPLIVVDGMSCLRKLYGKLNWICGGQWKGYIEHFEDFGKSMKAHNIKLVFFFDGNTPERKRQTWSHRRIENLKDVTTYFNLVKMHKELEHGKHFFLPTGLAAFTPLIVKDILGCDVYTCQEECDKAVAEYAKKYGAMGILGQDSDYVIYNTAHYYFSINHLNLETLDTTMYDRNALCRHLDIKVDQLPILSCLIGNDVIHQEQLILFHQQTLKITHHQHRGARPCPEILIPKVVTFINSQPPMDQLMQQLPHLAKTVFKDENKHGLLTDGIKMYQLDLDGSDEFTEKPDDQPGMDIYERVRTRHIDSILGRHLFAIFRGEPYESSTTLEDYTSNLPSGAIVFQPLRAKVYKILQKSNRGAWTQVPEWCMYSGNALKEPDYVEPVELEGGTPSLEELWEGDDELKWKTYLSCIHPKLPETKIRSMPQQILVPICILFYVQCGHPKPIYKEWEMNALIAAILSPIHKDINQIRAIALSRTDARAVHCAAIFMKGLVNFYFLIAACDFIIDRKYVVPWRFWDGKIFHHLYLKAKSGAKIEELCCNQEEVVKLFIDIKALIVPHIPPPPVIPKTVPAVPQDDSISTTEPSPQDSPKKKHRRGHSNASTVSPSQTPVPPPGSLSINNGNSKAGSAASSPTGPPPGSPQVNKAKSGQLSPPGTPAKSSAGKSPKKTAS